MMHRILLLLAVGVVSCKPADQIATPASGRGKDGVTVALAGPIGYVKVGDKRIAWHPSPGISRYEVVVSDSVETPLFSAVTRDTQAFLPDTFKYSLSQNYRWYVTAYRDRDSTAWRSPIAVFRLEGEGRRMPPLPQP
jgi:uncharacterized protein (UPF0248 family)